MKKGRTPKRLNLSDYQVFLAKFKSVMGDHLPATVRIRRPYRERAAPWGRHRCRQAVQRGWGFNIGGLLRVVFDL